MGAALVEQGLVEEAQVKSALVRQLHCALRELVGWDKGQFAFEPEKLDEEAAGAVAIEVDTQGALLDVLREIDEANR